MVAAESLLILFGFVVILTVAVEEIVHHFLHPRCPR